LHVLALKKFDLFDCSLQGDKHTEGPKWHVPVLHQGVSSILAYSLGAFSYVPWDLI
jgi:hypothetical protein